MPAKNKFYKTFYTKTEFDNYISQVLVEYLKKYLGPIRTECFNKGIDTGTTYGIDMAIIALGRMQEEHWVEFDHEFFMEFMKTIEGASADYCDLFDVDILENNDKDLWWSGAKMDQELQRYVGDWYPPFEKRYNNSEPLQSGS